MLVLLNAYFYYIKSSIKRKSFSKIEYTFRFNSRINGKWFSLCNSEYRFASSSIKGKGYSK